MIRRPPSSPLFPYRTLFRSRDVVRPGAARALRAQARGQKPGENSRRDAQVQSFSRLHEVPLLDAGIAAAVLAVLLTACLSTQRSEEHTPELHSLTNLP